MLLTLFAAAFLFVHEPLAQAALTWSWQYSGAGISAAGTFTTEDMPDADGFYQITGITGTRNGVAITGFSRPARPFRAMSRLRSTISCGRPRRS